MKFGPPLFWLGASLWVGGLASLAVAAPVIFRTAPSREAAGLIFGAILRGFSRVEFVCALLAAAGLALSWSRPALTIDWIRAALLAVMIILLVVLHVGIVPTMETLRPQMSDPSIRDRFQSLHRVSELLYKVNVIAGIALILVSAWGPRRGS